MSPRRTKKGNGVRHALLALGTALGLALSVVAFWEVRESDRREDAARFERAATNRVSAVQATLAAIEDDLAALDGLLASAPRPDRSAFGSLAGRMESRHPATQALEWVPRVLDDDRQAFEESLRAQGLASFQITERGALGVMVRAGRRSEYYPVNLVEPFRGNEIALGFDLASDDTRRAAIERAIASGKPAATRRVHLVQERGNQFSVLVFQPVFDLKAQRSHEGRRALLGFALGVYRLGDLLTHAMTRLAPEAVDVEIRDVAAPPADQFLASYSIDPASQASHTPHPVPFESAVHLADRVWKIYCWPQPSFYGGPNWRPWAALASGLVVTGLLVAVSLLMAKALSESETRYRTLFECSADAIVATDAQGRYVDANPAALKMLGYPRDELLGLHHTQVTPARWHETREAILRDQVAVRGYSDEYEQEFQRKDGRLVTVSMRTFVHRDSAGHFAGAWSVARDITERKRTERELRYERDLNRSVTENAAEAIFITDERGQVVFANREAERTFGFTSAELRGRSLHETVHHHRADGLPYPASECPATRTIAFGETMRERADVFFRKDGSPVNVSCSNAPIQIGGKQIGSVLIAHDVTELLRTQEALNRSEARFRTLIEKCADIILVLDAEGRHQFWSQGATEALGWTADEAVGKVAFELIHPEDQPRVRESFRGLLDTTGKTDHAPVVYRCSHKDGAWRQIESQLRNCLNDPAVGGIVVNGRDVTHQKSLEEQFQQAQKLESIGRLAGGVAHDFNNLLTVILSGAEVLKQGLEITASREVDLVDEITGAGERARDLTRQLLTFARRQVIAPVPLDLNTVIRNSEKLLRRVLGEDVGLSSTLHPDLWAVRCDAGQIEQVIFNLAVNARDAMPSGGKLTIETTNFEVNGSLAAPCPVIPQGAYVRLSVRDSGFGMTPEVKAQIFEPFFTTKPVGRGTGLGLSTVYGIVKQSDGYILVESEPGRGTTFDVYLPRTGEVPSKPKPPRTASAAQGTETVLVVEDDQWVREITVRSLRAAGYVVHVAAGGSEGVELGLRRREPVHLLLTDVVMPDLDGRAVAEELRRHHPEMRVLYVSGHAEEALATRGALDPGIEFLAKPFTKSSLLKRVREVLDGG